MILPTGKLLVNGFLIFNNTFTIIVTQRTRELALLRSLGPAAAAAGAAPAALA
jgi:ABC-type lipoprotein release transport system permease subunit